MYSRNATELLCTVQWRLGDGEKQQVFLSLSVRLDSLAMLLADTEQELARLSVSILLHFYINKCAPLNIIYRLAVLSWTAWPRRRAA